MFFIMGIQDGFKTLENKINMIICKSCKEYVSFDIIVKYTSLTLFFIPVLKWGKEYYAKCRSCGALFKLDSEKGKMAEKGEEVLFSSSDFSFEGREDCIFCPSCGYRLERDFEYCPKCGKKL